MNRCVSLAGVVVMQFATVVAQVTPMPIPQPIPQQPIPAAPSGQQPQQQPPVGLEPMNSVWVQLPANPPFSGFPIFPSLLSGYGGYPVGTGLDKSGAPLRLPPAPSPPPPPGWPSWVMAKSAEAVPFAPDRALLVRHSERVWFRPDDEEPFVPLFFHDKSRVLTAGAAVEVRQNGEFELLLHESSRLLARGPSRIRVIELSAEAVQLQVSALTWLRIEASSRRHSITLPDGSPLEIPPPAPPAAAAPSFLALPAAAVAPQVADVLLVRADEPAWLGGRATLTNYGTVEVIWKHASGEVTLPRGHRVTLFLQPPNEVVPAGLVMTEVKAEAVGDAMQCRAERPGVATWCGARFTLPAGASVRFDPQQGRPFAPAPAAVPVPTSSDAARAQ